MLGFVEKKNFSVINLKREKKIMMSALVLIGILFLVVLILAVVFSIIGFALAIVFKILVPVFLILGIIALIKYIKGDN